MKSSATFLSTVIVVLVFAVLYISNPNEEQLKLHLKNTFKSEARTEGGVTGAISELFAGPQAWAMSLTTTRKNFAFFSFYTVEGLEIKHNYIGILNSFIELPN